MFNIESSSHPIFSHRAAKRLLTEIVEKGRPTPFHHNDGPGMTVQEILVPASKAGLVIGKGGETIKQLQVSLCAQASQGEQHALVLCGEI